MLYTHTFYLATLAVCTSGVFAAPASSSNSTTSPNNNPSASPSSSSSAPVSTASGISTTYVSPYDPVYQHLTANGKITWTTSNGGHGTTILREDWEAAMNATGFIQPVRKRATGGGQADLIEGLGTDLLCYGRGMDTFDSYIQGYTTAACKALLDMGIPAGAQRVATKALQVWQSGDFAAANKNGEMGYLRYSFEILNDVSGQPDQNLCEQAMDLYISFCQDKNALGSTQGGENTVGGVYKFNVDPTGDADNY